MGSAVYGLRSPIPPTGIRPRFMPIVGLLYRTTHGRWLSGSGGERARDRGCILHTKCTKCTSGGAANCPFQEFPRIDLRLSRKAFRASTTFFLEIFLEISAPRKSAQPMRGAEHSDVGSKPKISVSIPAPGLKPGEAWQKALIFDGIGVF